MKVGSLLYENTCSEWLHVVYCKYKAFELADPPQRDYCRERQDKG